MSSWSALSEKKQLRVKYIEKQHTDACILCRCFIYQVANALLFIGLVSPHVKNGVLTLHAAFVFGELVNTIFPTQSLEDSLFS